MDKARIAELLRPFLTWPLADRQLAYISTYIDILLKWNQRINLTAVRQPEEIVTRHFGESLFAAQVLFPAHVGTTASAVAPPTPSSGRAPAQTEVASDVSSAVDVGSGAGFPGLPIKIWAPEIRLTLVESNHKKAIFLKEVVRELGLERVEVFIGRAESFPASYAELVTLRAVERFADVLPVAIGCLKPGGRLALLVGKTQIDAARATTLQWQEPIAMPLSSARVLLVGIKPSGSHYAM